MAEVTNDENLSPAEKKRRNRAKQTKTPDEKQAIAAARKARRQEALDAKQKAVDKAKAENKVYDDTITARSFVDDFDAAYKMFTVFNHMTMEQQAHMKLKQKALDKAVAAGLPFNFLSPAKDFADDFDAAYLEATKSPVKVETTPTMGKPAVETLGELETRNGDAPTESNDASEAVSGDNPASDAVVASDVDTQPDGSDDKPMDANGDTHEDVIPAAQIEADMAAEEAHRDENADNVEAVAKFVEPEKNPDETNKQYRKRVSALRRKFEAEQRANKPFTPKGSNVKEHPITDKEVEAAEKAVAEEIKVDDALVKHGSFAAAAEAEAAAAIAAPKEETDELATEAAPEQTQTEEPATEAPTTEQVQSDATPGTEQEQPAPTTEVVQPASVDTSEADTPQEQVQDITPQQVANTETVVKAQETVGRTPTLEVPKPEKKPTLAVDNTSITPEQMAELVSQAKKFYGSAFTEERSVRMAEAMRWLNMALRLEAGGAPKARVDMAFNRAVTKENEAFGVALAKAA